MEFTVRKFDFLQELTLIQGVVERKTTIPILANVLVRAEAGELGIVATDLEIGLKSVCAAKTFLSRLSCHCPYEHFFVRKQWGAGHEFTSSLSSAL